MFQNIMKETSSLSDITITDWKLTKKNKRRNQWAAV